MNKQDTKLTIIACLGCVQLAAGHGRMVYPPAPASVGAIEWSDNWFSQGSMNGCGAPSGTNCNADAPCCDAALLMQPTLTDPDLMTYPNTTAPWEQTNDGYKQSVATHTRRLRGLKAADSLAGADPLRYNPWKAPGNAPVADPCGILGGWRWSSARDYIAGPGDSYEKYMASKGGPINVAMPPANMSVPAGTHGTEALLHDVNMKMQQAQGGEYTVAPSSTAWKADSTAEVAFTLVANHGGGYQYRLCKLENLYDGTITEKCFEENPLDYASNESWFQVGSDPSNRTAFPAVRVSTSVQPAKSTWTKIPLPACAGIMGGSGTPGTCDEPQFPPPVPGMWGFGNSQSQNSPALASVLNNWAIVDEVHVPAGLEGGYVLQWRWDSEQTPQVWTQCSVINIE